MMKWVSGTCPYDPPVPMTLYDPHPARQISSLNFS